MPFCCQCGSRTADTDLYCAVCGARQPVAAATGPSGGISPRTASLLCYIPLVGWIPAIIVLASKRFRTDLDVRFHAFQGIYLFVAWLLVDWVIAPLTVLPHIAGGPRILWFAPGMAISGLLKLALFACWILMLIKVNEGVRYKLPLFGELADRSLAEQK
ncbi:MAG: hypothetical protein K6T61_10965 [Bryobacteraceae bacterium]|nr:hypothetical protein [Bryobacteraceae bacterium]